MKKQQFAVSAIAFAVSLALTACGSGTTDTTATETSATGSTTTTTTTTATTTASTIQGVITGFGSVFVNGVEYDIDTAANVTLDGTSGSEASLKVGMVVTLKGTVNADGTTGLASDIQYADNLEGVVIANNVAANGTGTLDIMGQTVNVAADTVFESNVAAVTSADLIAVGNVVEVSGYSSSTGDIFATRIEVKSATQAGEIEIKGVIANLTPTTFTIGSMTVDFSNVASGDMPNTLTAGDYVQVKSADAYSGSGSLMASKIEMEDDGLRGHDGAEGEELDVKGAVTVAFDATTSTFELNGRSVLIDSNTDLGQGSTDLLTLGAKVKAETHFNADGALVADSIEFDQEGDLEFANVVEAVDTTAGTLTVMGQTFYVDNNTMMIDESADQVRYFDIADISATNSDYLEIQAYLDSASGHLMATKVKRGEFSSEAQLKGSVSTANGLTVEGITVDTSNAGSVPTLADGDMVEMAGSYSAGVFYASEISVE